MFGAYSGGDLLCLEHTVGGELLCLEHTVGESYGVWSAQ